MWFYILAIIVGFIGIAYFRIRKSYSYFRTHGVAEDPGHFSSYHHVKYRSKIDCTSDTCWFDFPYLVKISLLIEFYRPTIRLQDHHTWQLRQLRQSNVQQVHNPEKE